MRITGIICEYNPLHLGHQKQLDLLKKEKDTAVVCLMSGNFVQRGAPAVFDKMARAEAAVRCGADLVLELPVTASLSSAEGFAAMGVQILSGFCHNLCFGAENADREKLTGLAQALLGDDFKTALHAELNKGLSFPSARQAALESMGLDGSLLEKPNNILAVEYCKAILAHNSSIVPMPIARIGSYHDTQASEDNPSATAIRELICKKESWERFVPNGAADCFRGMAVHTLAQGEQAILSRLRRMEEKDFEVLPHGSEGLWRKLMHAVRREATLEQIIAATKSKRYTRTRLDRMILCAFLGITEQTLASSVPYVRILAFNNLGREVLKVARENGCFINAGEVQDHPWQQLEDRCGDLYGLFAQEPEAPGRTRRERVYYHKKNEEL